MMSPAAFPAPLSSPLSGAGVPVAGNAGAVSRISQREARRHLSSYGGDQAIDGISNCVNLYVDAATQAKWYFKKDGTKYIPFDVEDQPPEVELAPPELVDLLKQPNPWQDWGELFSLAVIDYLLVGNFYWLKFRSDPSGNKPLSIYRLAPQWVTVIPGQSDLIAGYEYQIPGRAEPVRFPATQVLHGRRPNPHNPYLGLGIVAAGARALDIELALTETMAQFFEQGAKLSGVLQTDRRVPDPVFKKLTQQFRSLYSGSKNAYKVAVLEQGLQFQSIQPTAAESEFVKLSQLSLERQAGMFRVPVDLLEGGTRPGILAEARQSFDSNTMRPFLNRMQTLISHGLVEPGWGYEFYLDYKYIVPRDVLLVSVQKLAAIPGVKVREVRAELNLQPLGDARDEIVLNLPLPTTEQPGGAPNRSLAGQSGRPPNGENVPTFPSPPQRPRGSANSPRPKGTGSKPGQAVATAGRKSLEEIAADLDAIIEGKAHELRDSPSGRFRPTARSAKLVAPVDPDGNPLGELREASVDETAARTAAGLADPAHYLETAVLNHVIEGKALRKADRGRLVAAVERSPAWTAFQAQVSGVLEDAARHSVNSTQAQHLAVGYDAEELDTDSVAASLANRADGSPAIAAALKEQVLAAVREGVRRGYTPQQILEGVQPEGYAGVKAAFADWRAGSSQLARSEAAAYHNEGTLRVAEASGHTSVLVHDADPATHGEVWPLAYARAHRGGPERSFVPVQTP